MGTVGSSDTATSPRLSRAGLVPDAEFLKKALPMLDVVRALGLEIRGRRMKCWSGASHFASLDTRRNRVKCFRCPTPSLSTIDLVCACLDCSVGDAIRWLDGHFAAVPRVRRRITTNKWGLTKHKFVDYPKMKPPASHEISLERFMRSPGWRQMPHAARSLAAKLLTVIPSNTLCITTSYGQMMKWTGVRGRATLARSLAELETVGLIVRGRSTTGSETPAGWATSKALVKLSWRSPRFQEWLAWGYKLPGEARTVGRTTSIPVQFLNSGKSTNNGRFKPVLVRV